MHLINMVNCQQDRDRTRCKLNDRDFMMAAAASVLPSNRSGKAKRKSYAREFKLTVVNHYRKNNLYQMPKRFLLNTKTILRSVVDKEKVKQAYRNNEESCISRNGG